MRSSASLASCIVVLCLHVSAPLFPQDCCGQDPRPVPRHVLFAANESAAADCDEDLGALTGKARTGQTQAYMADPYLSPGDWLYGDLEPVVLSAEYRGPIRVRNFTILGDLEEIELSLFDSAPERRFQRVGTRTVDRELVSVFELSFPNSDFADADPPSPIRFDRAGHARIRPSTIPRTRVVRINDRVQFSSHVVNIVWPCDSATRPFFPVEEIAQLFYQYFSDTYEELAFAPARFHSSP